MDYDYEIVKVVDAMKKVEDEVHALAAAYQEARDFTMSFLDQCSKRGLNCVSIGVGTKEIKSTLDWPFGYTGHVFADGEEKKTRWPIIWAAVEEMGIGGGSGNTGEHSIALKYWSKLVDGVYKLKDGKWERMVE